MPLSFRRRIFLGLVGLGTLPLAAALLILALQVWSTRSSSGPRAALDEVTESGRAMLAAVDTMQLSDSARVALRQHAETVGRRTALARRAEMLRRYAAGALGVVILVAAVFLVGGSLQLARKWSSYFSAPVDELVRWVRLIQRREPLPESTVGTGAPEFDALRQTLQEMSHTLEQARRQELERERLSAFSETARRVAHEIRGPLTSARLAVAQLVNTKNEANDAAVSVLRDEIDRLEQMAREFSEFGRLPEGPEAPVDIGELIDSALEATVPDGIPVQRSVSPDVVIDGHYEPLRRAVQNLLRNAVEVTDDQGIAVTVDHNDKASTSSVQLRIADHGPGVPREVRDQIFEPYFTTKELGTGLGLALVKQTVNAHGGSVTVENTPGGGATFVVELPKSS